MDNTSKKTNCVGYAYSTIGYKGDAYYEPNEVLGEFREVPSLEAEIVAAVYIGPDGKPTSVRHVTPYPPDEQGRIKHRPHTGAAPIVEPYEDAIGYMREYDGLIYLRRKEG